MPLRSPQLLAGVLATAGVLHFAAPKPFDGIVPKGLPGSARTWTHLSGVAELGCAAAVARGPTWISGARSRIAAKVTLPAVWASSRWAWRVR